MTTGKTTTWTIWIFVGKVMSLLFNMLPRIIIVFLPRSKCLLISWLQLPSTVIFEPKKIKPATVSILEKAMALHSSTLVWKIPWMEEPGRLQSMGSQRVGHDWATSLSLSCFGEGNGNPIHCSCLKNPRDRGAWWAAVYGVAQSWTWLKRLSSNSSSSFHFSHLFTMKWWDWMPWS